MQCEARGVRHAWGCGEGQAVAAGQANTNPLQPSTSSPRGSERGGTSLDCRPVYKGRWRGRGGRGGESGGWEGQVVTEETGLFPHL